MIQLVSYRYDLNRRKRIECAVNILNRATEPFVLFSGSTILEPTDIYALERKLKNHNVTALLEVSHVASSTFINNVNCLFLVHNGKVKNLFSQQLFATSNEIKNNEDLAERLLLELEQRRKIVINEKKYLILQCGEINILSNIQSEHNRVVFRFSNNCSLQERFQNLIDETDIILNPMHTPMGNQGKMQKRREYLSACNHYYFSCSNTKNQNRHNQNKRTLLQHKLQYAYKNSMPLLSFGCEITDDYIMQYF